MYYITSGSPSFQWDNRYGNESLSFWGGIIWNRLPDEYKAAKSCDEFKMEEEVGRDLDRFK